MVAGLLAPDAGRDLGVRHRCARRSGRGQADHGLGLRRADDLRQAHAVRISRIRRRPVGHRAGARRGARERPDRLARARPARPRALRRLLQGHAAEGGARRRAGARAAADHPRRAADRPRRRLRAAGQERAARARRRRRHRHHDHAHPRSRRAHGRPHRRDRRRPADRAGHARRAAASRPARAIRAWRTRSSRWSPNRSKRREPPRAPSPSSRSTSSAWPGATGGRC